MVVAVYCYCCFFLIRERVEIKERYCLGLYMTWNDQSGLALIALFRKSALFSSLLLEDSEEEEGDLCRICQMAAASSSNLLIEPCKCTGSLQYVHQECMKKWLQAKINSGKI